MPSSYSDIRRYHATPVQLHKGCRQLLDELGWNSIQDEHGYVVEKLPNPRGSGFNNVTIYIHHIGAIVITCECTSMEFNPRRNREVVDRFLDEVGRLLEK